jgi:hypothetical protein
MAQSVSRRPVTAEARLRSWVSLYEICGGWCGNETGFSPSTSVFPCHYHSTNAPYSSSSMRCPYQNDKRAKRWYLPERNALWEIGSILQKFTSIFMVFERLKGLVYCPKYWQRLKMNHDSLFNTRICVLLLEWKFFLKIWTFYRWSKGVGHVSTHSGGDSTCQVKGFVR